MSGRMKFYFFQSLMTKNLINFIIGNITSNLLHTFQVYIINHFDQVSPNKNDVLFLCPMSQMSGAIGLVWCNLPKKSSVP